MAIDLLSEHVISLADAARLLPRRRSGKKPHVSCLYRWTKTGCKGVILESIQVGGTRCTSKEGLARFFAALTDAKRPGIQQSPASGRGAAAERELQRQGI